MSYLSHVVLVLDRLTGMSAFQAGGDEAKKSSMAD